MNYETVPRDLKKSCYYPLRKECQGRNAKTRIDSLFSAAHRVTCLPFMKIVKRQTIPFPSNSQG